MTYYLTHVKDVLGNNYLGINFYIETVQPFLNELKEIIGEEDFEIYTDNQNKRDRGNYHMTLINVMEYNKICKEEGMDKFVNSLGDIFKYEIDDLKMMGVGTATKNENRTYFIVCESDKLDAIRTRYNLPKRDLHITLGFKWKDVFGVPKNQVITKVDKFLKLLEIEYYKNDNWNFIRNIGNFNLDKQAEIIPIELKQNRLKTKCDGQYIEIILLDDERFWISNIYPIDKDEELPRLPETEIAKIFNK
jgi:hypothetical protein